MAPAKRPLPKRSAKRAAEGKHAGEKQVKRAAGKAAKKAVQKPAPPVDALARAAWLEADAALADAIVECGVAIKARRADERDEALFLTSQALARAARRRGLTRFGKSGALEAFDPRRHELGLPARRAPERVRIVEEGVARGGEVLVKARAKPARAKRT